MYKIVYINSYDKIKKHVDIQICLFHYRDV